MIKMLKMMKMMKMIKIMKMMKMIKMIINPASIRNEAQPVLNLYYNQTQSSQHPKRGTASTKLVLQSSTIQPASTN